MLSLELFAIFRMECCPSVSLENWLMYQKSDWATFARLLSIVKSLFSDMSEKISYDHICWGCPAWRDGTFRMDYISKFYHNNRQY